MPLANDTATVGVAVGQRPALGDQTRHQPRQVARRAHHGQYVGQRLQVGAAAIVGELAAEVDDGEGNLFRGVACGQRQNPVG